MADRIHRADYDLALELDNGSTVQVQFEAVLTTTEVYDEFVHEVIEVTKVEPDLYTLKVDGIRVNQLPVDFVKRVSDAIDAWFEGSLQ